MGGLLDNVPRAQRLRHLVADRAGQQVVQAQDRFAAGVVSNIEVVQAQEAEATAEENYISSLFGHNFSKLAVARAIGVAEDATKRFLGGKQ